MKSTVMILIIVYISMRVVYEMVIVCRLPFYYEMKILFVLWLLSPATKGASILYRKFLHPQLAKREKVGKLLI